LLRGVPALKGDAGGNLMRQLVGLSCVRCGKPVKSIIEGRFCDTCGCPVHAQCVRSVSDLDHASGCADCGATGEQVKFELALLQQDRAALGPQTWGEVLLGVIDTCLAAPRLALSGLTGILLFVMGVVSLILEATESVPANFAAGSMGVCAMIVASVKLLLLGYLLRPIWKRVVAENASQRMHRIGGLHEDDHNGENH
jgi:hypothetical protein